MSPRARRPASLDIMGLEWDFTWDTASMPADSKEDAGETCPDEQRICINAPRLRGCRLERTVLHEVIHAILFVSGQDEQFTEKQEESLVRALENGLYPVLLELVELGYFRKPRDAAP